VTRTTDPDDTSGQYYSSNDWSLPKTVPILTNSKTSLDFVALSKVKVGSQAPPFDSKGVLLNAHGTWKWIKNRNNLIGWTYSFDAQYLVHFKRLIVGRFTGVRLPPNIKFASNIHQKIYIDQKEMLVSSQNLVAPTIQNLSVVIRDQVLINYMKIIFNKQWRYL